MTLFTVHRTEMAAALAAVVGAVERRNTIPILSNVLLSHDGSGTLALKATNLDIEIAAACPLAGDGVATAFTVPAKTLEDIVRKLPESADIRFEGDPSAQVTIRGSRSKFTLHTLPESDFPQMDGGDLPHQLSLTAAELTGLLSPVQFAISTEETRYYLNGIYFHPRERNGAAGLAAVATDGHRLAFRFLADRDQEPPATFPGIIVPAATVALVLKIAKTLADADPITITLSDSRIVFDFGHARMASKLIDGSFPDYQRVIPTLNPNVSRVAVKPLAASLGLVSTISGERGRAVKMTFAAETLGLEMVNPDAGQSTDEIAIERVSGDDVQIGFNARYALDVAERITTDTADIALAEPGAPAVVTPTGDDTTLFVLMPMRF